SGEHPIDLMGFVERIFQTNPRRKSVKPRRGRRVRLKNHQASAIWLKFAAATHFCVFIIISKSSLYIPAISELISQLAKDGYPPVKRSIGQNTCGACIVGIIGAHHICHVDTKVCPLSGGSMLVKKKRPGCPVQRLTC